MNVARRLRPISKDEIQKSYADLKALPCDTETIPTGRQGLKALDAFFLPLRLAAKTKRHVSFLNALKNKKLLKNLRNTTRRIKRYNQLTTQKTRDEFLRNQYATFQLYYGTINQFKPSVARWFFCHFNPTRILDFSAGWGGRAMAAMSLGIPYIGFDANKKLQPAYKKLHALDPTTDVKLTFQPSETVDFSKYTYDLVFTSPPYFMLEEYEGMPAYVKKQGFIDDFFVPVVKSVWNNLSKGGHMALNMPEDMYHAIKGCLPPLHTTFKMPLSDRHAEAGQGAMVKGKERFEYVYVWKKGAAFTDGPTCGRLK